VYDELLVRQMAVSRAPHPGKPPPVVSALLCDSGQSMTTSKCGIPIHVRARSCNEVDAGLLSGLDERFDVAEAREVDAGTTFGLVQAPEGVKRDCVQAN
jgi:hypothetical protein